MLVNPEGEDAITPEGIRIPVKSARIMAGRKKLKNEIPPVSETTDFVSANEFCFL